jgi:hypothetical protein
LFRHDVFWAITSKKMSPTTTQSKDSNPKPPF